jgi:hypothetical protein
MVTIQEKTMKTQLLILACSSFILFGCNKNTASQQTKDTTETQAASETKTIDPDRQQLMDELAEYKDNPDIPPVQEKLARAYYEMLKTGGGDLEEIRGFISELQDTEQAAVEQAAQRKRHLPMKILKFVCPLKSAWHSDRSLCSNGCEQT